MKNSTNHEPKIEQSQTPLKVGLVLDDSLDRNDGVQQYVRSLGGWLSAQGHTVHYLCGQSRSQAKTIHSLSRNVGVRFNGNRLTIPLSARSSTIKTLLAKEKYDILHIQMPYSPVMAGKIIKLASTETAIIGTFHILPFGWLQELANKTLAVAQKRQLRRFDAICSVSASAQQFAKSHYGLVSSVIPNMIDTKRMQTVIQPHPKRIVYLGRLVHRKGCAQLLKAMLLLPESIRCEVEVLIAGDGPERKKLEKFAQKHNLSQVKFLGYIEESQKADLLGSAEIAVFPSLGGESFGIVLIEAMAAGAGVVMGGDNPGYKSVLSRWNDAMFDPRDIAAFSMCLQKYLHDEKLRLNVHSQQQASVQQYDVNTVGSQIVGLYQQGLLHSQR